MISFNSFAGLENANIAATDLPDSELSPDDFAAFFSVPVFVPPIIPLALNSPAEAASQSNSALPDMTSDSLDTGLSPAPILTPFADPNYFDAKLTDFALTDVSLPKTKSIVSMLSPELSSGENVDKPICQFPVADESRMAAGLKTVSAETFPTLGDKRVTGQVMQFGPDNSRTTLLPLESQVMESTEMSTILGDKPSNEPMLRFGAEVSLTLVSPAKSALANVNQPPAAARLAEADLQVDHRSQATASGYELLMDIGSHNLHDESDPNETPVNAANVDVANVPTEIVEEQITGNLQQFSIETAKPIDPKATVQVDDIGGRLASFNVSGDAESPISGLQAQVDGNAPPKSNDVSAGDFSTEFGRQSLSVQTATFLRQMNRHNSSANEPMEETGPAVSSKRVLGPAGLLTGLGQFQPQAAVETSRVMAWQNRRNADVFKTGEFEIPEGSSKLFQGTAVPGKPGRSGNTDAAAGIAATESTVEENSKVIPNVGAQTLSRSKSEPEKFAEVLRVQDQTSDRIFDNFLNPGGKLTKADNDAPANIDLRSQVFDQIEPRILGFVTAAADLNDKKTLKIRLKPADLGTVEITLEKNAAGKLDAHFKTESPATREILNQTLVQLRNSLENSGLRVGDLDITCSSFSSNGDERRGGQQQRFGTAEATSFEAENFDGQSINEDDKQNRLLNLSA